MRRRRSLEVWPAYADLMTVLAVCGLFAAAALFKENKPTATDQDQRLSAAMERIVELQKQLESAQKALGEQRQANSRDVARLRQCAQDVARNQKMFDAIQVVQRQVDEVSQHSGLKFGADQSLEFGEDLVTFAQNEVIPTWQPDGRRRLQQFCAAVSAELGRSRVSSGARPAGSPSLSSMFVIEVEGHTDGSRCPGDPHCNWPISSSRAANFAVVLHQPDFCPGGATWNVRPIGYADTRPPAPGSPERRITVRITPDYQRIVAELTAGR